MQYYIFGCVMGISRAWVIKQKISTHKIFFILHSTVIQLYYTHSRFIYFLFHTALCFVTYSIFLDDHKCRNIFMVSVTKENRYQIRSFPYSTFCLLVVCTYIRMYTQNCIYFLYDSNYQNSLTDVQI